ncbi:hypothetical protein CYMTET_53659, partial [Cymbomonas tetramitiformis]
MRQSAEKRGSILDGACGFQGGNFVVTGASGYLGRRICESLLQSKARKVLAIDTRAPVDPLPEGVAFLYADILDLRTLTQRFHGSDAVLHVASYGMSGKEMLNRKKTREINVLGTRNVIAACIAAGVARLVYTSTYNVVFGGVPISNGSELLPYYPAEKHVDEYSASKTVAEQLVLSANGAYLPEGSSGSYPQRQLATCAIRSAAIYGEGEERHFPRIVRSMNRGLFCITIGDPSSKVDWVHVDNLVHAHLKACQHLLAPLSASRLPGGPRSAQSAHGVAAGQAYFISDGAPVNNFQFLRGVSDALGVRFPAVAAPVWAMITLAWCIEIVWQVLSAAGIEFNPLITRAEVLKVGVTHYFSTAKAKAELGYDPPVSPSEGQRRLVEDILHKEERQKALLQAQRTVSGSTLGGFLSVQRPHLVWWMAVLSGMALLALCACGPTPLPGDTGSTSLGSFVA